MLVDTYMGQFMRFWYSSHAHAPPPPKKKKKKKEILMKVQAKLYGPVHDTFVFIAYASSEGLDEPAHLRRSPQPLLLALKEEKGCR